MYTALVCSCSEMKNGIHNINPELMAMKSLTISQIIIQQIDEDSYGFTLSVTCIQVRGTESCITISSAEPTVMHTSQS